MSTKNLNSKDAKQKMTSLIEAIKVAMLVTDIGNKPLSAVPMWTKKVDEDGNIWFLSRLDSDHNNDIIRDNNVQLLYSDPSDKEFISIYGKASVNTEKEILKELFSKADNAWFEGLEAPTVTAIKIEPKDAYYWDTKTNKYVSLFKMGIAAVTGKDKDIGEKGKLNL